VSGARDGPRELAAWAGRVTVLALGRRVQKGGQWSSSLARLGGAWQRRKRGGQRGCVRVEAGEGGEGRGEGRHGQWGEQN
jgi:hypothetical protein